MDTFKNSIKNIFQGAAKSFYRFPASIISAGIISIISIIRINMGWEVQQNYDFLFNSLQLAFILGAIASMALVVLGEVKLNKKGLSPIRANGLGIILALASFILLYFFGGMEAEKGRIYLTDIASARMAAAIFVSGLLFVYFISRSKIVKGFSQALFMSQRAFAISAIYGLVTMLGVSGVLGAFQALVYRDMNNDIYQYLGVLVGFFTYTIFLGYYPDFSQDKEEEKIDAIVEQPRFIYVLFSYILVPIMIGLTGVLLIWSARVVFNGLDVSFNQLSSIASSYVIVGIWLHIMVADHQNKIANFYKKAYPFSGILVLAFEAWALFIQLNKFGLKTAEYSFGMIWIFGLVSLILLIWKKHRAYGKIAITGIIISIIWVLPFIGYEDLTYRVQITRLENRLIEAGILENNQLIKSQGQVDQRTREEITQAVDFLSYTEKKRPAWFKEDLNRDTVFKDSLGFEKTYGTYPEDEDYRSTNLMLVTDFIDIKDYDLSLNINGYGDTITEFQGPKGTYDISWTSVSQNMTKISVKLEDEIIIEKNLDGYLENLLARYPLETNKTREMDFDDMSIIVEGEGISILIVFENISIYSHSGEEKIEYYTNLEGIYIGFK